MKAIITNIRKETSDIFVFRVKVEEKINYIPGQFFMLSVPGVRFDNKLQKDMGMDIKRAYSVCSTGAEDEIEFCVKREEDGTVSVALTDLKVGDEINLVGPYGKFTLVDDERDIVLMSIGSGISPMMSFLRHLVSTGDKRKITFLFGNKTIEDISYKDEIIELCKKGSVELIFSLTRDESTIEGDYSNQKTIHDRLTLETLENLGVDYMNSQIYMCGKLEFVKSNRDAFKEKGLGKEQVHFEIY